MPIPNKKFLRGLFLSTATTVTTVTDTGIALWDSKIPLIYIWE